MEVFAIETFQNNTDGFTSFLNYRKVQLRTAKEVAELSFIVQDSISHLDLELCQFRAERWKDFTPSSNVLCSLHLEWPKEKDWSLKKVPHLKNMRCHRRILHRTQISIAENFYIGLLYQFIDYACKHSVHSEKILKWFIKFGATGKCDFHKLPENITNHFFECMHSRFTDLEFVKECFRKLPLVCWLFCSKKPGIASDLFYQVNRAGRKVPYVRRMIIQCVLHLSFIYTEDVLKFKNDPMVDRRILSHLPTLIFGIRPSLPVHLNKNLDRLSPKRRTMMLHLFWVYLNLEKVKPATLNAATKSLRLLWNAVPDPFLCFDEIWDVSTGILEENEIGDICDLYSTAAGEFNTYREPRSLQHYSRTTIRKILWKNKHWLPDGVEQTGLPRHLKAYLNLEI
ncbi:hypothetical protein AVEN_17804-1 [Araneus ventricosus]|uniref:SOCS box domain-containing protein n=1 Tax=Araneus ventricosus TaxID=182803 RepID=A0A4Y2QK71_ARAVE|nr:hypothetical protein AVEN_17804-1 [Araneus ventricosus]